MEGAIDIYCAEIEMLVNGNILLKYRSDIQIGLKDVKEVEQVLIELSNGSDIYAIVDSTGPYVNITNEAQNFLAQEASIVRNKKMKGSAVVINSLPNRLLVKFFIKLFRPQFPTKIFSNLNSANEWLEGLKSRS